MIYLWFQHFSAVRKNKAGEFLTLSAGAKLDLKIDLASQYIFCHKEEKRLSTVDVTINMAELKAAG